MTLRVAEAAPDVLVEEVAAYGGVEHDVAAEDAVGETEEAVVEVGHATSAVEGQNIDHLHRMILHTGESEVRPAGLGALKAVAVGFAAEGDGFEVQVVQLEVPEAEQ